MNFREENQAKVPGTITMDEQPGRSADKRWSSKGKKSSSNKGKKGSSNKGKKGSSNKGKKGSSNKGKILVNRDQLVHIFKLMWMNKSDLHLRKRDTLNYMTAVMDISIDRAREILNSK